MFAQALAAAALIGQTTPGPRYQTAAPFPGISWIQIDDRLATSGIANSLSRLNRVQARILWVDATANIGAVNTPEKIRDMVDKIADAGFNTIVYDVKPIVGYTLYPSRLTEQLTSWRGNSYPKGYDPLRLMQAEARRRGLSFYAALNAFSEGHRFSKRDANLPDTQFGKPGWGYDHPELQTWQYNPTPVLRRSWISEDSWPLSREFGGRAISVHTKTPPAGAALYAVLDQNGRTLRHSNAPVEPAAGGSVLAAGSESAAFLRDAAPVGREVRFDSEVSFAPIAENQTQIPLMMNPALPENQQRAASFIEEVLQNYAVDGVIYDDRLRWGGLNADFSPRGRELFEKRIGRKIKWPDDVFKYTYTHRLNVGADDRGFTAIQPGPWFDAWLAWRVETMADFMRMIRRTVNRSRPGAHLGVYAGSWYGDYASYGNNYGSDQLQAGFSFLNPAYRRAGFASKLDFLITGCYYPVPTIMEAERRGLPPGRTVEAGAAITNRVARDQTWSYAGIMLSDYWGKPVDLEHALQAAAATTQGVMVFDYSHRIEQFWPVFARAFRQPARAPHQMPGLLDKVRARRAEWDRKGYREAPFPLLEGAPGAGF